MGASAGDDRQATVPFPDDYPAEEVAGKTAEFEVQVKEVREKELPDLDDDFAAEASEFDTLTELRDHISGQIKEILDGQIAERFREAALDAAVANATVELPEPVVEARAAEMWRRVERSLQRQGMEPENYLQIQGKTREEMIEQARPEAEQALKREAVLEAVAKAEGIEVTEEDMLEALQIPPGHEDHGHPQPAEALKEIRESGREELLKEDLRMRRALELIAEESNPIPLEQAKAREEIWTPEKEQEKRRAPSGRPAPTSPAIIGLDPQGNPDRCAARRSGYVMRDFGALHEHLVPGFVTDCRMDGEDRIVTFASGAVVREVLIDLDDEQRRLVWSIVDGPYRHHNGVAQVSAEGDGSRFVWTTDLLADDEVIKVTEQSNG